MKGCATKVDRRIIGGLFLLFWGVIGIEATPTDPYAGVNTSWDRFGSVYGRIVENYYADIDQKKIMQAAIDGMLEELDSYSQFYDEEGLRQLRQDTTGKFAGLGITVAIKDHYPVVITPIEETPAYRAGLVPGDLIVEIEGQDTRDMPLDQVVDILRGDPGTQVRFKVAHRAGETATRMIEITREIIKIKSVILVDEIEPGVGYISMRKTRFSEETAEEVEQALEKLKSRGSRGVILDLRGNPGGLLSQATQVADLFLPKGAPVVSVKERYGRGSEVRHSQRKPVVGDLPLVVLIDGGSASASEIVAGAIQDNDRGIILGETSFGKGSVQTIFDLHEVEDSALKLTTALYYTPSGRSIHRETAGGSGEERFRIFLEDRSLPAGAVLDIILRASSRQQAAAGLRARFDLDGGQIDRLLSISLGSLMEGRRDEPDSSSVGRAPKIFLTRKGRKVYGGGGITPDIVVEGEDPPDYVQELERRRLFFDFIVDHVGLDSVRVQDMPGPEMMAAFWEYLAKSDFLSSNSRAIRREFDRLKELVDEMGWDQEVGASIDSVATLATVRVDGGFSDQLAPHILRRLNRELALRLKGRREQLRVDLEQDPMLEEAIEVLMDLTRYWQVLEKGAS